MLGPNFIRKKKTSSWLLKVGAASGRRARGVYNLISRNVGEFAVNGRVVSGKKNGNHSC